MNRVLTMIALVWGISAIISIPPLIGWNDWPAEFNEDTPCKLSEEKSYLIYSSSGSFFIPLIIMTVVYFKIFKATRRRLRDRAKASAMANLVSNANKSGAASAQHNKIEIESASDEKPENNKNKSPSKNEGLAAGQQSASDMASSSDETHCKVACVDQISLVKQENQENAPRDSLQPNSPHLQTLTTPKPKEDAGISSVKRFWEEKQKISLSRERRATRILGMPRINPNYKSF